MARFKITAAALAALAFTGTSALAGGFADEIVEAPVVMVEPAAPTGSIPGWVIPAVLVAGLIALAVSSDDSEDDDAPET